MRSSEQRPRSIFRTGCPPAGSATIIAVFHEGELIHAKPRSAARRKKRKYYELWNAQAQHYAHSEYDGPPNESTGSTKPPAAYIQLREVFSK
jgi:hypothetical protein